MKIFHHPGWLIWVGLLIHFTSAYAQSKEASHNTDGHRDFEVHLGTWKTHVSRLSDPLSGSSKWIEMNGITTVKGIWDGRANLVELIADSPTGRFEGLSLRLYNPQARQWSIHFASGKYGVMTAPTVGSFRNGIGEFFGQESIDGRIVLVRFIITVVSNDALRFEQAFSEDGGKNWEVNWVATDTRISK